MKILIAEDERITRRTLAKQLEAWGHEVTAAEDGAEAWERFQGGEFDVVVTDWEMPRLDGRELIERIRASSGSQYTYLIMVTSRSETAEVVQGMEAGADDFLGKPFDKSELRARLNAGERIIRSERALSENLARLRESQERIQRDLAAAATLQHGTLPRDGVCHPSVELAWRYVPCDELGGDGVGLHVVDDRYLIAHVIDVTGHGVPAALLSYSLSQSLLPGSPTVSLPPEQSGADGLGPMRSPQHVADALNAGFPSQGAEGRFATMFYAVLDIETGVLHGVRAGHPVPHLFRGAERLEFDEAGGLPIGIMEDEEYPPVTVQLAPGDRLFAVSDGVIEQVNASGEMFGVERVEGLLGTCADRTLDETVETLIDELGAWSGGGFDDDVTVVSFRWRPA